MALGDLIPESSRKRIKGTDPKLSPLVDKIGRGTRPMPEGRERMTADMAAEAAGRRPSDADVNDAFARRLSEMAEPPDYEGVRRQFEEFRNRGYTAQGQEVHNRPLTNTPSETMSSSEARYRANLPKPYDPKQRYYHTSEAPEGRGLREHAQSFRDKGIIGSERTSFGEGKQVFAHPEAPRKLGPRQVYVEFEPGVRPSGSGTSFMGRGPASTATSFSGDVPPERVRGVYGNLPEGGIGRLAGVTGLMGLANNISALLGGPYIQTPADWVLNDLIANTTYGPGGIMDPYRDYRELPGYDPQTGTVLA